MKEAYCSYKISELLKKKGFDAFLPFGFNSTWHTPEPRKFIEDDGRGGFYDDKENWISCPTHQMAMAWLREKHFIIVVTPILFNVDYDNIKWGYDIWADDNLEVSAEDYSNPLNTYEEATETALKYTLENLI